MKIKIITLNIFNGEFLEKCIDFLKTENPDIFVLQEVYDSQATALDKRFHSLETLKQEFKHYFCFYSRAYFKEIEGNKVDNGNAVFSKFAILKKKTIFYYREYTSRSAETVKQFFLTPRNLQHVVLTTDDAVVNIFNTQGVWGLDGKDNKDRLKMSEVIVDQIKNKKKIILAGDFNVSPNTKTIRDLEKYLVSVFNGELKTTFNMKQKIPFSQQASFLDEENVKGFATAVVDMIFVSPDIKVIDHYCPQLDISDHFPLVAILEV